MRNCYFDYPSRSIADLCDGSEMGFKNNDNHKSMIITRISVLKEFRGKGIGRKLLTEICNDADREHVYLYLEINPYGDMTYEQLEEWYKRYGFEEMKKFKGVYRRKPKS